MPRSLVPKYAPSSTLTDVESFLMSQCRLVHDALPDGNCMFRALSHQLYGGDQHHVHVRSMLLEVIESNKIIFTSLTGSKIRHGERPHLMNICKKLLLWEAGVLKLSSRLSVTVSM